MFHYCVWILSCFLFELSRLITVRCVLAILWPYSIPVLIFTTSFFHVCVDMWGHRRFSLMQATWHLLHCPIWAASPPGDWQRWGNIIIDLTSPSQFSSWIIVLYYYFNKRNLDCQIYVLPQIICQFMQQCKPKFNQIIYSICGTCGVSMKFIHCILLYLLFPIDKIVESIIMCSQQFCLQIHKCQHNSCSIISYNKLK